ncbi:MAG TPA: hypothetical protein DCS79_00800 [Gammaproteobacteria bacterium]|nr:hypothetical protein [Gammaproteobacteria bacterium]
MAAAGRLANSKYSSVSGLFLALAGYNSDNSALQNSLFVRAVARLTEVKFTVNGDFMRSIDVLNARFRCCAI